MMKHEVMKAPLAKFIEPQTKPVGWIIDQHQSQLENSEKPEILATSILKRTFPEHGTVTLHITNLMILDTV